jgi:hypothetical protein
MNARAFLVRGLLAGLIAGVLSFFVAYTVGEPSIDTAIAIEEAGSAAQPEEADHHEEGEAHTHSHAEEGEEAGTEVPRSIQSTWGLLTATLAVGLALGGLVGLAAASAAGRMGSLSLVATTVVVTALGFLSFSLVPFLKYPSTPPAVGNGDTIGERTGLYFGFLLVSVLVAIVLTIVATRLAGTIGTFGAVVGGIAVYVILMVLAGQLFPTVNEIGDFPGDTLWYFRRGSMMTIASMWAGIGVVLTGLLLRLQRQVGAEAERRELAASL